jgi:ATP-dependent RNA helicase DeaD
MSTELTDFSSFGLSAEMLSAIEKKGFTAPTSIQAIALPALLTDATPEHPGHLVVKARTGTGKTAAFGIPLLERLKEAGHAPKAIILTPTRELAQQITREITSLRTGAVPRIVTVYGGASVRNQIFDLKRGAEIVVGTPGRVMDMMERKTLDLSCIDWFILDEADEMLDMGFIDDVETILKGVKPERRVALFSATMPQPILRIVREHLGDVPIIEDKGSEGETAERPLIDQFYLIARREVKTEALKRVIDTADDFYGLVFCATKIGTDELARRLVEAGYKAESLHGDMAQEARERTLRRFRSRQTTILVATDVAARGLDIERLTHVVNYDLPNDRETYVHRIGRTGRAGRRGRALSIALPSERGRMQQLSRGIEKALGSRIEWTKAPSVKSVMKAMKGRIRLEVMTAAEGLPEPENTDTESVPAPVDAENVENTETSAPVVPETAENDSAAAAPVPETVVSPYISQLCGELSERLGAERALEALLALHYSDKLDPSRYVEITDFEAIPARDARFERGRDSHKAFRGHSQPGRERRPYAPRSEDSSGGTLRVYVGLGRKHGAGARDVAELLQKVGGVPGRLVDGIEVKEYCAFATLPAQAARRACDASRRSPQNPVIRPAKESR